MGCEAHNVSARTHLLPDRVIGIVATEYFVRRDDVQKCHSPESRDRSCVACYNDFLASMGNLFYDRPTGNRWGPLAIYNHIKARTVHN